MPTASATILHAWEYRTRRKGAALARHKGLVRGALYHPMGNLAIRPSFTDAAEKIPSVAGLR
jgi:hypothetical protein